MPSPTQLNMPRLQHLRQSIFVDADSHKTTCVNGKTAYIALGLVILAYVTIEAAFEPQWLFGSSMWAEMGINYYPNSVSPSWITRLFSTDAGYIPLPQRLIAIVPVLLGMPAPSIPYFYNWSALLATALLAGSFCLPHFRKVIESDTLRASCALVILFCSDFDTRNFISFTYFSAFFIAATTALVLADDSEDTPWWMWIIPIFFLSKPAVMSALPAVLIAALLTTGRFRWIAAMSLAVCMAQVVRLIVSQSEGMMSQESHASLASKALATLEYFPALLLSYGVGPYFNDMRAYFIVFGIILILAICFCAAFKPKSPPLGLVMCGLSLLFTNLLINCMTLSDAWGPDLRLVTGPPIYRHIIVGFFGVVMVVCGLVGSLRKNVFLSGIPSRILSLSSFILFASWFVISGWLTVGGQLHRGPHAPVVGNSQWDIMSERIDQARSPLCIPIDPLNWTFGPDCKALELLSYDIVYKEVPLLGNEQILDYKPPARFSDRTLVTVGLLLRPKESRTLDVKVQVSTVTGQQLTFYASRFVRAEGGMVALSLDNGIKIGDISSMRFVVDCHVDFAFNRQSPAAGPVVSLMGR